LENLFEARRIEYSGALRAPYYLVSKRFAAYKNVELERARNELEEHRSVCPFAFNTPDAFPEPFLLDVDRHEELGSGLIEYSV
jgi:hypothetical protein